jgi:methionine synthase II (cobalamin-independent)
MTPTLRAPVLLPGLATGIGSLPHSDARAAAEAVLRCLPELPAVPQLPARDPREGMLAQWLGALPEVAVEPDGAITVAGVSSHAPECVFDEASHAGALAFFEVARALDTPLVRVKAQITGPLTLGVALHAAGMPERFAFRRAAEAVRAWLVALEEFVGEQLPHTSLVVFLDEPALVRWRRGDAVLDREAAIDVLSGALAAADSVTGVHVCGDGDVGLALEAGPQVLGLEVSDALVRDTVPIARFLDADGWIAWGAVPTDRPVGESADPHWRRLASVWCELTRRGCDPVSLRARGIVTPACGLAGYGATQAERVLGIARELAARVHDQAVAARLTLGA